MVQNYALVYVSILISTRAVVAYVALFAPVPALSTNSRTERHDKNKDVVLISQQRDGSVGLFRVFYKPNC